MRDTSKNHIRWTHTCGEFLFSHIKCIVIDHGKIFKSQRRILTEDMKVKWVHKDELKLIALIDRREG